MIRLDELRRARDRGASPRRRPGGRGGVSPEDIRLHWAPHARPWVAGRGLPTHRDNYFVPFDAPRDTALARLAAFVREVHAASPTTRVIIPKYFDPIVIPPAGR